MSVTTIAPHKSKTEKQILAERAIIRAKSGLYFLEDIMRNVQGGTDGAYSRSRYILLSYNFELILNSLFILACQRTTRDEIMGELIAVAKKHDFAHLFNKIPASLRFGINKVDKDESSGFTEYHVQLNDGTAFVVQDLIDVRYDFKKDTLRATNSNEAVELKTAITALIDVAKEIVSKNSLL